MNPIAKLLSGASGALAAIAGLAVLALVCHVTLDVILRYVFNAPLNGTILFVSTFYMVAIAFLPLALVEQGDNHISVELLFDRFPGGLRRALMILGQLLTVIVASLIAIRSGEEAIGKYALGTFSLEGGTKFITWPSYFILPAGFGLMALVALWRLIAALLGIDSGFRGHNEIAAYMPAEENHD
jgi:TRAP-type C4-dicarboxylate transport system permease small subunit